jgi:ERCC4-type nuclease
MAKTTPESLLQEPPLKILIDTRENDPLPFSAYDNVVTSFDTLEGGDYTLVGHDRRGDDYSVIIERKKNCAELVRNLGAEWDRFRAQLEITNKYAYRQIIVCSPDNFEYLYSAGFTKLHPNFVYKRLADILVDYGVGVTFLYSRQCAENYIYRLFSKLYKLNREES